MAPKTPKTTAQTTTQEIPPDFKPAFLSLFNSAFGASRQQAQPFQGGQQNPVFNQTPAQSFFGGSSPQGSPQGFLGGHQGGRGSLQDIFAQGGAPDLSGLQGFAQGQGGQLGPGGFLNQLGGFLTPEGQSGLAGLFGLGCGGSGSVAL